MIAHKKKKVTESKGSILEAKRERIRQESLRMEQNRKHDEAAWLSSTREWRAQIRWSLTSEQMKKIYLNVRNQNKMTIEKLCISSNTSRYAVEAIEKGSAFDTYTIARLMYFLLTNNDIDDSMYKNHPVEVFVDYLAGKKFRFHNNIPPQPRTIDNPKACNLTLYLKK